MEWYTGATNSYRMGKEGQYDLCLADNSLNVTLSENESENDDSEPSTPLNGESHPTKLLRHACAKMLQIISMGVGIHSLQMDKNSLRCIASMYRTILRPDCALMDACGLDNWALLAFLRSIAGKLFLLLCHVYVFHYIIIKILKY